MTKAQKEVQAEAQTSTDTGTDRHQWGLLVDTRFLPQPGLRIHKSSHALHSTVWIVVYAGDSTARSGAPPAMLCIRKSSSIKLNSACQETLLSAIRSSRMWLGTPCTEQYDRSPVVAWHALLLIVRSLVEDPGMGYRWEICNLFVLYCTVQ